MTTKTSAVILAMILVGAAGCTNMTREQQGTVSGGAIGAAAGAGIAAIAGGNAWTGAAIGGIGGAVVGNMKAKNEQRY